MEAEIVTEVEGVPGRSTRWVALDVLGAVDPEAVTSFGTAEN